MSRAGQHRKFKRGLSGARLRWYMESRLMRVTTREMSKWINDTILFGTGFLMMENEPDYVRHIPIQDVIVRYPARPL